MQTTARLHHVKDAARTRGALVAPRTESLAPVRPRLCGILACLVIAFAAIGGRAGALERHASKPAFADPVEALGVLVPSMVMPPAFGPAQRPPGDWRPYADTSVFNVPLPADPRIDPRSDALVAALTRYAPMGSIRAIDGRPESLVHDYSRPFYYSGSGDPVYRVLCTDFGTDCPVSGEFLRIPGQAQPAGGSDGHLTVLEQASGREWSFYNVQDKPPTGGDLLVGWGATTAIAGDGLRGGGGAAEFGGMAGRIRFEELMTAVRERSSLRHALFMTVMCTRSGAFVAPATKAESKRDCGDLDAPEMGRRFFLDMEEREINALPIPEWRKVIARTMARYGAFVGDAGGSWGFQFESGMSYLSFGQANPFVEYAEGNPDGIVSSAGVWYYVMRDGIPWRSRLRALSP